ncbi:phosphomannomutase/phosphoglucomutase [Marinobacterium arenosum]|uniref:phosphomannomutase/phosphoglucomutase n=1 Tax=Marinobacterium arenosum TaxID=2862496 RepID=UPI001C93B8EE|nr:phosphomannomutase/phosphoglucomutase [Marinobacterium arenosum]MBY4678919.1 phosphomannomutase/phosphoglucomutase [Marinobacterium arenosum]
MRHSLENLDQTIFRAYDIRGIVDQSLTEASVYHLGRAFAAESRAQGYREVVVAADGRLSSPALKECFGNGLRDGGCDVLDVGFVPTPLLYFATHHRADKTGVMITGSHNPANYNGFKMMIGGDTLSGDQIQALKRRMLELDYSEGAGSYQQQDSQAAYLDYVCNDIKLARPLKVVVDCGNGIPGVVAPELLERLGCEVIPLYCEVDGTFPNHHPDPGKPANLVDAIAKVKETGADLGLAFDGDGDRVGVITEHGKIIYPDRFTMLFAEDIISRNPGAEIIYDVKCSRLLAETIRNAGGKPTMWKTGHSLIKGKMKQSGALLAGEMSGHIFFKERWFGFDDGLYSAARLLEILAGREQSADAVFAGYPEDISTPELNIEVCEESKFEIVAALQQQAFDGGDKNCIDGVRVDYPDGWGLVRASNTTPMLVLRFEAESESALNRIRTDFQQRLHAVDPALTIPDA